MGKIALSWIILLVVIASAQEFTAEKIIGLGYQPGERLAPIYVAHGINSIKCLCTTWGGIEPVPPDSLGNHTYQWTDLDSMILQHQRHGITEFCLWLGTDCEWATCHHWAPIGTMNRRRPLPEHEADYYDWVYNLVERYDNDGQDDVPGIHYPVLMYMVESEAQQIYYFEGCSWDSHLDDYIAVLAIAYRAMHDACEDAQTGLSAALFMDMFDDFPDTVTLLERLAILDSLGTEAGDTNMGTREMHFIKSTLAQDSLYDFACFHPLSWWQGLYGQVQFIRNVFDSLGIDKPIVADDAVSGPMYPGGEFVYHLSDQADSLYNIIGTASHPLHDSLVAWHRANQSRHLTKMFVVALSLGVRRMWIETSQDWWWFALLARPWAYIGLVDYNFLFPRLSVPRPALHTLKLLKQKFEGYREINRLEPLEDPARLYIFRFEEGTREDMLCLWFENHIDELAEEPMPDTALLEISGSFAPNRTILRTWIITSRDDSLPPMDTLYTNSMGNFTLPALDETPVFLEDIGPATHIDEIPIREKIPEIRAYPSPFNKRISIEISPSDFLINSIRPDKT
ncbi:hypothetical protein JW877_04655, partial [bacterium]|nr:hypothetical protein [bacterium]